MINEVYLSVFDEGTPVWRPVPAWKIDASTYIVLRPADYDPEDENWEFPPGSIVTCESRKTSKGTILAAVRRARPDRQTA